MLADNSSVRRKARASTAMTASFAIAVAAALVATTTALGAQGDNDIIISAIEQDSPSVVTIHTPPISMGSVSDNSTPRGFDVPNGLQLPSGTGSGVIIDPDGLIITNRHVVGGASDVSVILDDGTVLDGAVTGVDPLTDFAFVDVDASDLPTIPLGTSSDLRVGQLAIAIGNPLGQFPNSASVGIVSGLDRSIDVNDGSPSGSRLNHLIQTDAAINPGNSGGAVIDGDGQLIGITTAKGGLSDGIGFALPIDLAKPIIEQALAGEAISRPYIGVLYRELDAQLAAEESLPVASGAWISSRVTGATGSDPVVAGSPADMAGIVDGDVITAVDGTPVGHNNPLDLQVLTFKPGEKATFSVLRDGDTLQLEVTLGTRPANIAR